MLHSVQLYHFSDALEVGYGAAFYIRHVGNKGRIRSGLVMAKSRAAPLKTVTFHRMEMTDNYDDDGNDG